MILFCNLHLSNGKIYILKNCYFIFRFSFLEFVFNQHSRCLNFLDRPIHLYQSVIILVVCKYTIYGKCINSPTKIPLLSELLNFFDTRFRKNGIE